MSLVLFLTRRVLAIVVLAWAVTLAAFALFRIGLKSPAMSAQISAQLGADRPALAQYLTYLGRLLHGNLGQTLTVGVSVTSLLRAALPPTVSLVAGGLVLWLVLGTLVGAIGALRPGTWADWGISAAALTGLALPTFLTALFLLQLSSAIDSTPNAWLQPGYVPFTESPAQWLGRLILPWIAIAATQVGVTARLARGSMLEVLGEDYIRTARANGVPARRVFWHHVLRPAITPVISNITVGFGMLLGSAAIVDQVFALGGIGQALLVAVKSGDLMVIMGAALLTFLLISLVSLIVDICQALLDPRVHIA